MRIYPLKFHLEKMDIEVRAAVHDIKYEFGHIDALYWERSKTE
jgi:hypothetical protein